MRLLPTDLEKKTVVFLDSKIHNLDYQRVITLQVPAEHFKLVYDIDLSTLLATHESHLPAMVRSLRSAIDTPGRIELRIMAAN